MTKRLKIAVVSPADPYNIKTWSGSSYFMMRALEKYCGDVEYIDSGKIWAQDFRKKLSNIIYKYKGVRSYPERSIAASKYFGEVLSQKLKEKSYDLIFAPAANVQIANLNTNLPIVYVSDATFNQVRDSYSIFSSLSEKNQEEENLIEQSAMHKSDLVLYPSDWAAQSAKDDYGLNFRKIIIVPFGANLSAIPLREEVLDKAIDGPLELFFLGKEWERKGGPIAFETLKELLDLGVPAKLTVCGVIPPPEYRHACMTVIPYLDKSKPEDSEKLKKLFLQSHFLIVPSEKECYGVVFCEANAYGLPVISKRVGGIPTIVKEGVNGFLFSDQVTGKEIADKISNVFWSPTEFESFNRMARKRYDEILNWDSWGTSVRNLIDKQLNI
jgi:glycosyltransferase involved in cell wall biosynthesis